MQNNTKCFWSKKIKRSLIIVCCLATIIGIGIVVHKWHKKRFYEGTPIFTEKTVILKLYQLMKDFDEVLTKNNVPYWVDFGSLLGAVRHKGIIPWDDDLDVSIELKNELQFLALEPIFKKLGYNMVPMFFGYKFFYSDGEKVDAKDGEYKFPFIDIFLREWVDQKSYYITRNRKKRMIWAYRNGEEIYNSHDEIYPLKLYRFGDFMVKGPNNAQAVLDFEFGTDWFDVAYQSFLHKTTLVVKKVKMKLTNKDRVPAQPTGPLKNMNQRGLELS